MELLERVYAVLSAEDPDLRPFCSEGLPGGLVDLKPKIPTIIVPDIHARIDFLLSILLSSTIGEESNLQMLASDRLQIVCVGDGFHAEARAVDRWAAAYEEYRGDYRVHTAMDEEMRESLGVMEMVMEVKCGFPSNFHFLKGNHENIRNEHGNGNYAFRKFTHEGEMVAYYMEMFYDEAFIASYERLEKNLPLLAVGNGFLVSHAEPQSFFDREDVIEYRERPEVTYGLTWTANGEAEQDSVARMLAHYLGDPLQDDLYYFGGHRPVSGLYNLRADGRYVQIHNPDRFVIALVHPDRPMQPDRDIFELENNVNTLIEYET